MAIWSIIWKSDQATDVISTEIENKNWEDVWWHFTWLWLPNMWSVVSSHRTYKEYRSVLGWGWVGRNQSFITNNLISIGIKYLASAYKTFKNLLQLFTCKSQQKLLDQHFLSFTLKYRHLWPFEHFLLLFSLKDFH